MHKRLRKANPISLMAAIVPVIKELGIETDIHFDMISNDWENIVGKINSMNIKPLALKQGVLSISVSSPVWMTQTRFLKPTLIDKINNFNAQKGAKITDITFSLDRS